MIIEKPPTPRPVTPPGSSAPCLLRLSVRYHKIPSQFANGATREEIAPFGSTRIKCFLFDLSVRFLFDLIGFTFMGLIGWAGVVLV
jgi:hypothetical protein